MSLDFCLVSEISERESLLPILSGVSTNISSFHPNVKGYWPQVFNQTGAEHIYDTIGDPWPEGISSRSWLDRKVFHDRLSDVVKILQHGLGLPFIV